MGVSIHTYLIAGICLGTAKEAEQHPFIHERRWKDCDDDLLEHGLSVIYDGMNGEYVYVGTVIAKCEQDDGFDPAVSFQSNRLEMAKAKLLESPFAELANQTAFHLFTHWH